jgi:hypothetical protein
MSALVVAKGFYEVGQYGGIIEVIAVRGFVDPRKQYFSNFLRSCHDVCVYCAVIFLIIIPCEL